MIVLVFSTWFDLPKNLASGKMLLFKTETKLTP